MTPPTSASDGQQDHISNSAAPQSLDDMRAYLGKRVLVTLDYDDPKATVVGVLHRLTDDGEVHVREDGGAMAYCWPCLRVEPWPND